MGRVKSLSIKKTTRQLLERYPESFTTDFEKNKKIIGRILPDINKRVRNSIAGYVTRLKKKEVEKK